MQKENIARNAILVCEGEKIRLWWSHEWPADDTLGAASRFSRKRLRFFAFSFLWAGVTERCLPRRNRFLSVLGSASAPRGFAG
jgi:hypothetical protein